MILTSGISKDRHAAIFGQPDDLWEDKGGKRRNCKACGGWHRTDEPWPHNCRNNDWRPPQTLAAPRIISDIEPHKEGDVIINSRSDQREFMRNNGLVEFETFDETAGTHKQDFNSKEYERDLVEDIKRGMEEDPLNRPPPKMVEEANAEATVEEQISTDDIEVVK